MYVDLTVRPPTEAMLGPLREVMARSCQHAVGERKGSVGTLH